VSVPRRRIAVVAAHPDDEVIGCGGTIAKHVSTGDSVSVLILGEGATSRLEQRDRDAASAELSRLSRGAREAHAILGTTALTLLGFPDNRLDQTDLLDIIKVVEKFLDDVRPHVVYTHFPHDLNIDHRIVSDAVQTACRQVPASQVEQVLLFEVASSTEWRMNAPAFAPNHFVDVSQTLSLKLRALAAFESELRAWPHPRSLEGLEHLAHWRGATVGCGAAEAFVIGRSIWK
jgi:N-acetylglucosamine malate deacetylase 1